MDKLTFLKEELVPTLTSLDSRTLPVFGKMNVHQMIEHMAYAFRQASGLIPLPPANDEATTAKMYQFMISEKPFRDNTPNQYLPDTPSPANYTTVAESLTHLQIDIDYFISVFSDDKEKRILNPFFGNLNADEWIHLLYKHAMHHLRQFGV